MAKTNHLIFEAKKIAKDLNVSVSGWGENNICFFLPKSAEPLQKLKEKLSLIGFNYIEDTDDREAGLVTFVDCSFKIPANPYMGKSIIEVYPKTLLTKALIAAYTLLTITLFFVSVLSAAGVIAVLIDLPKYKALLLTSFLTFVSFQALKHQTLRFKISDKDITMKDLFRTRKININDIASIKTGGRQKLYEKIIFTLNDKSKLKTHYIHYNKARLIRDALIEAAKTSKI